MTSQTQHLLLATAAPDSGPSRKHSHLRQENALSDIPRQLDAMPTANELDTPTTNTTKLESFGLGDESSEKENIHIPFRVWLVLAGLVALVMACCCCIVRRNAPCRRQEKIKKANNKERDTEDVAI